MTDAKRGLRLLSFSIILQIAWGIFSAYCPSFIPDDSSFRIFLPLITQAILIVCYLIDFAGLRIAGHNNNHFKSAWRLRIISLLLAVIAIAFAIVVVIKQDAALRKNLAIYEMIVDIVSAVNSVLVLLFVIKGCREISPRVAGLSKFVGGVFTFQTLLVIGMEVLSYFILKEDLSGINHPVIITEVILAVLFSICAIIFTVFYILLILRTTANVGKARKR